MVLNLNSVVLILILVNIAYIAIALYVLRRKIGPRASLLHLRFEPAGELILYILPLLGLCAACILLVFGQLNLLILSIYLIIPIVFVPIMYLVYQQYEAVEVEGVSWLFNLLLVTFILGFSASLFILYSFDIRPLAYYVIVTTLAAIIMSEIMLFDNTSNRTLIILLQVMALTASIIWGVSLKYYYFIGRTDSLGHVWYARNLLDSGYVTAAFDDYISFPLWQILCSFVYMVTGTSLPISKTMFFTSGLIYSIVPLAIFILALKITKEKRIALLSSLFISFYQFFMILGMQALSRSITSAFMIVLVFILLESRNKKWFTLAVLLTLAIIVYHPVAIIFITLILFLTYLIQKVFVRNEKHSFLPMKYFAITIVMVVAYWILFSQHLLVKMAYNLLVPGPTGILTTSIVLTPLNELFNYMQFMPLLFFILFGVILILLSDKFNDTVKSFSIVTLALVPFTFPGPVFLINKLSSNFQIERFYENGFLFMSIMAAIGFAALFLKSGRKMKVFLTVLFAILVLLSVSNDFVSSDNPLVKRPFFTHYLTESEVTGIEHFSNLTVGYPMTDYAASRYQYFSPYRPRFQMAIVDDGNMTFLRPSSNDTIMVRSGELEKRPLDLSSVGSTGLIAFTQSQDISVRLEYFYKDSPLWDTLENYNRVYDSSSIRGYD